MRRIYLLLALGALAFVAANYVFAPTIRPKAVWQPVRSWSGDAFLKTETFEIASDRWRVSWKTESSSPEGSYFAAWVYSESSRTSDGIVSFANEPPRTDMKLMHRPPGRYYLEISSVGLGWTVSVEDQR